MSSFSTPTRRDAWSLNSKISLQENSRKIPPIFNPKIKMSFPHKNDGRFIIVSADSLFQKDWTEPLCETLPLFPLYTEWPFEETVDSAEPMHDSSSDELDRHEVLSSQTTMRLPVPAISKFEARFNWARPVQTSVAKFLFIATICLNQCLIFRAHEWRRTIFLRRFTLKNFANNWIQLQKLTGEKIKQKTWKKSSIWFSEMSLTWRPSTRWILPWMWPQFNYIYFI